MKKTMYLTGPITGLPDRDYPAFNQAALITPADVGRSSDPLLVDTKVIISHVADDGYWSEETFNIFPVDVHRVPPVKPLIDAIQELARLTSLYGFDSEALSAFRRGRNLVRAWKLNRETKGGAV